MTPKCPKCGNVRLDISQHGELVDVYRQDTEGKLSVNTVGQDYTPERVRAKCLNPECEWEWTVRGVCHISELDGYILNMQEALKRAEEKSKRRQEGRITNEA